AARPDRIDARPAEGGDHQAVVEIGAHLAGGRREQHRGVGVAYEGRVAIDRSVKDDGTQVAALARAQALDRAKAPHGRVAAVDDAETANGRRHVHSPPSCGGRRQAKATNRPWCESERSAPLGRPWTRTAGMRASRWMVRAAGAAPRAGASCSRTSCRTALCGDVSRLASLATATQVTAGGSPACHATACT